MKETGKNRSMEYLPCEGEEVGREGREGGRWKGKRGMRKWPGHCVRFS